ncbi:MAG: ROK family protein [Actinomycetota bacterium]|nr:ROK family protein [Actinomycetota bacterium]
MSSTGFGIDIGGSGMKAAPVDLATGELADERFRIPTPQPATAESMADVVSRLVEHFGWQEPLGVAFPAVVRRGVIGSAANIDKSWIDTDADAVFTEASGKDVHVINDADAAGLAELRYGVAAGRAGVVLMLTFGTGIGSGLFVDGALVPNTELGHLELDGAEAEARASAAARDREELSWAGWAKRVDRYLDHVTALFSPDLIVIGGGVSKRAEKWLPHLSTSTEVAVARLFNTAGIVGAALARHDEPSP